MDKWDEVRNNAGLDFCGNRKEHLLDVKLEPGKWKGNKRVDSINDSEWKTVKYHNSGGKESSDFKNITATSGGVFLWVISPKKMPLKCLSIVAYIGSSECNIKSTVSQFISSGASKYTGQLIKHLFSTYSEHLYLVYYECKDSVVSEELREELINAISPQIRLLQGTLENREAM